MRPVAWRLCPRFCVPDLARRAPGLVVGLGTVLRPRTSTVLTVLTLHVNRERQSASNSTLRTRVHGKFNSSDHRRQPRLKSENAATTLVVLQPHERQSEVTHGLCKVRGHPLFLFSAFFINQNNLSLNLTLVRLDKMVTKSIFRFYVAPTHALSATVSILELTATRPFHFFLSLLICSKPCQRREA